RQVHENGREAGRSIRCPRDWCHYHLAFNANHRRAAIRARHEMSWLALVIDQLDNQAVEPVELVPRRFNKDRERLIWYRAPGGRPPATRQAPAPVFPQAGTAVLAVTAASGHGTAAAGWRGAAGIPLQVAAGRGRPPPGR